MRMMPIEMRAWIPAKEMPEHQYHSDGKAKMFYQNDQYLQSFLRRAYMEDCGREHESYISEGFKLMLWTGCKTKGVKIFDQDVLMGVDKEPMLVEWHFNRFIYRVRGKIQEFNKLDFEAGFFTVVGNALENPELFPGRLNKPAIDK